MGGQSQGHRWLEGTEGGPVGVQAAAPCKGNNVIKSAPIGRQEGPAGAGMQSPCPYTSQRSDSLHVIYREILINLVNRRNLCDTSKVICGKNVDFRNTKTWVQIMTLVP